MSPSLSPDWTECGVTKGCWLVPISNSSNCSGHDCQAAVSFRKQGDVFLLELAVKGHDHYIAVGFSDDEIMVTNKTNKKIQGALISQTVRSVRLAVVCDPHD